LQREADPAASPGEAGSGKLAMKRKKKKCPLCGAVHDRKISCLKNWLRGLKGGK